MIVVDRRKRKQERETNVGAVIVLPILATLVCGGGVYTAFSGKLDDGVSAIMLLCSAMVGACAFAGIWYLAVV
jgi:hypothetical protein